MLRGWRIIEEFPYLGFLRPNLIGVTFNNTRTKAIKDLQEKRLKLYLNSGQILNFND